MSHETEIIAPTSQKQELLGVGASEDEEPQIGSEQDRGGDKAERGGGGTRDPGAGSRKRPLPNIPRLCSAT